RSRSHLRPLRTARSRAACGRDGPRTADCEVDRRGASGHARRRIERPLGDELSTHPSRAVRERGRSQESARAWLGTAARNPDDLKIKKVAPFFFTCGGEEEKCDPYPL